MAQEYLPAPSNVRLADLMKKHNISQPELAKEIGCSKSTISRFISGAKGTLTHQQVLKIARLFKVSTDIPQWKLTIIICAPASFKAWIFSLICVAFCSCSASSYRLLAQSIRNLRKLSDLYRHDLY